MAVIRAIRIVLGGLLVMALVLLLANRESPFSDDTLQGLAYLYFEALFVIVMATLVGSQFVAASFLLERGPGRMRELAVGALFVTALGLSLFVFRWSM